MRHEGTRGDVGFVVATTKDGQFDIIGTADCPYCAHNLCIEAMSTSKVGDGIMVFRLDGLYSATMKSITDALHAMHSEPAPMPETLRVISLTPEDMMDDAAVEDILTSIFGKAYQNDAAA